MLILFSVLNFVFRLALLWILIYNYGFLMTIYQNKRGGRVKLQSMLMPCSEFDHAEKGDALHGKFLNKC